MVLTSNTLTEIRTRVKADIAALATHIAVGDDNTTPTPADTTLANEVFRDSVDEVDQSPADKVIVSLRVNTTEANGNDIKETGSFNAGAAGTMWSRDTLNSISKTDDINLFIDLSYTIVVEDDT